MEDKNTDFPQYRMLSNGKSFYRIRSTREFDEVQLIGSRKIFHSFYAHQYPEMLKIQDLLSGSDGMYVRVDESRWRELGVMD